MPRVRTIKSFVWNGRDVDIREMLDVSDRDATLLCDVWGDAVRVADEAPAVTAHDPAPRANDPKPKRRR